MVTETTAAEATTPEEKPEEETTEEIKNPLELSDEEFLKSPAPRGEKSEEEKPADTEGGEAKEEEAPPSGSKPEEEKPKAEVVSKDDSKDGAKGDDKAKGDAKPAEPEVVDYEAFFQKIMTPFKANGKTFEVKTPDEAIRLMQQGAGYGRKLQDMQPHLKVLRMLEKNNLLDESKLSYLIDLNQKKPDAIKKLIKDGGIDPLDLNPDDKVTYVPTNHAVSDKEVVFHQAIAEVQQAPGGHETLQLINQTWDKESKSLLWDEPEIFGVIQGQRENGVYDQILAEIDRQRLLGHIKQGTPFLQAYKAAGDHLTATNGWKAPTQQRSGNGAAAPAAAPAQQPQVIATRTAAPKTTQAQNSERAAAASPTKAVAATKPAITVNPLEMADDDFMQQFKGRF